MTELVERIAQHMELAAFMLEQTPTPLETSLTAIEAASYMHAKRALARRMAEVTVQTVRNAFDDRLIEEMCRAMDREEAAQKGEPTPWRDDLGGQDEEWKAERICAMRCALRAVGLAS